MSAVLIVEGWSSRCGSCRRSANPEEECHDTVLGYGPDNGKPGCGERFTSVQYVYPGHAEKPNRLRADLPLHDPAVSL